MLWFGHRQVAGGFVALGISLAAGGTAIAQNLVSDPSFETSGAAYAVTPNASYESDFVAGGWTISSQNTFGSGPQLRNDQYAAWPIHSGSYAVAYGSPPPSAGGLEDTLSQTIATAPGTTYLVSFWLDNFANNANPTPTGQGFTANFASGSLSTNTNLTAYTQFSFTATATSSTTTLYLAGFDYTNSGYYMLDDVSVIAQAASGPAVWANTGSGDWNTAANWSTSIPNAVGAEADFLSKITAASTVTTSQAETLGTVRFNNSNAYLVSGGGSLTLQTSTGSALIDLQAGTHTIALPLTLASNTTFRTDSSTAGLVISGPLVLNSGVKLATTGPGSVTYSSSITLGSGAAMSFTNSTAAQSLTLGTSATATIAPTTGTRTYLQLTSLSLAPGATLDITDNDLVIHGGTIGTITSEIGSAFFGGTTPWTGSGITSSPAAGDSRQLTAIGVIQPTAATTIDTHAVGTGDVFLEYTYFGDANLDGKIDGSDYSLIDNGYLHHLTGWYNGDFNYDNTIDGSDYTLIDNAFNNQGAQLQSALATVTDSITTAIPEPSLLMCGIPALLLLRRRRQWN